MRNGRSPVFQRCMRHGHLESVGKPPFQFRVLPRDFSVSFEVIAKRQMAPPELAGESVRMRFRDIVRSAPAPVAPARELFAASSLCTMNQWCPDGVDKGMSPRGKRSVILTLTTCCERPRILKATGQSCQSVSHTGRERRWACAPLDGHRNPWAYAGGKHPFFDQRSPILVPLLGRADYGKPVRQLFGDGIGGIAVYSSVRVSLNGTPSISSIHLAKGFERCEDRLDGRCEANLELVENAGCYWHG